MAPGMQEARLSDGLAWHANATCLQAFSLAALTSTIATIVLSTHFWWTLRKNGQDYLDALNFVMRASSLFAFSSLCQTAPRHQDSKFRHAVIQEMPPRSHISMFRRPCLEMYLEAGIREPHIAAVTQLKQSTAGL